MPHKPQSVSKVESKPQNAWRPISGAARGILAIGRIGVLVFELVGILVWAGFMAAVWLVGELANGFFAKWPRSRGGERGGYSAAVAADKRRMRRSGIVFPFKGILYSL
jgi:hypothetical protein